MLVMKAGGQKPGNSVDLHIFVPVEMVLWLAGVIICTHTGQEQSRTTILPCPKEATSLGHDRARNWRREEKHATFSTGEGHCRILRTLRSK